MAMLIKTKNFELAVYMNGKSYSRKVALLLPGRLDTKDYAHMKSHVDFLANKGYLALSFDPPGTWESLGDINDYTMTNYLKAINELIEHFGNKPTVIIGHSRGGTMAMLAGSRNKYVTQIISIMARASPSAISDKAKIQGFEVSLRDNPFGEEKRFELPLSYFKDGLKYNVFEDISKCTKPKLFIFGKKDKIINAEIVKETYEKVPEPKQINGVESPHDYRFFPKIINEINSLIEDFLDKE